MEGFAVKPLTGKQFRSHLKEVAALHLEALLEFPYLLKDTQEVPSHWIPARLYLPWILVGS